MNFSMIDLCSKALNKIGASEIVSPDEGTPEAEVAASFYPILKRKLLSGYPWSFAARMTELAQVPDDMPSEYARSFALPNDFLKAVKVFPRHEYKIMGGRLFSNADRMTLTYIADVGEDMFPPAFASALVYALAAEFAVSLLDDSGKFSLFHKLSQTELKEARFLDSSQESPKRIGGFPLIDARK